MYDINFKTHYVTVANYILLTHLLPQIFYWVIVEKRKI